MNNANMPKGRGMVKWTPFVKYTTIKREYCD